MYLILIIKYEIGKKIFNDKNEHSLLQGHTIMNSPNHPMTISHKVKEVTQHVLANKNSMQFGQLNSAKQSNTGARK